MGRTIQSVRPLRKRYDRLSDRPRKLTQLRNTGQHMEAQDRSRSARQIRHCSFQDRWNSPQVVSTTREPAILRQEGIGGPHSNQTRHRIRSILRARKLERTESPQRKMASVKERSQQRREPKPVSQSAPFACKLSLAVILTTGRRGWPQRADRHSSTADCRFNYKYFDIRAG